jgi:hypothetical protein
MNTEIGGDIISHSFLPFPPLILLVIHILYILHIYYTSYTHNTMRQLKHHEQKLLKKVDFLSVSHLRMLKNILSWWRLIKSSVETRCVP